MTNENSISRLGTAFARVRTSGSLVLAVTFFFGTTAASQAAWFNTDWKSRQQITVASSKVVGTHTNFPLLVSITTDNPVFLNAKPDGTDILFTKSDGTTQVPFEKDKYDPASSTLAFWVKTDTLSSGMDTVLYMYYNSGSDASGNTPSDVWSNDYVLVQHMQEDPSGSAPQFIDSSFYGNSGNSSGTMTSADQVAGQIGGSLDFDGSDDFVLVPDADSLDLTTGSFTISAWFKAAVGMNNEGIVSKLGGTDGYRLVTDGTVGLELRVRAGGSQKLLIGATGGLNDDTLHHVVGVFVPSTSLTVYMDGAQDGQETSGVPGAMAASTASLLIGARQGTSFHWTGLLDEIRVAKVARSPQWILMSYSNQASPTAFLALSAEENQEADWYNLTWQNRQKITIPSNNVCGTHFSFPLLVSITNDNPVFSAAKASGGDILFTRADGTTKIAYEKEEYDATSTQLVYWVLMNSLSSNQNACIYMYYNSTSNDAGNVTTDVWTSDFVMVQHMQEDPSGSAPQMLDSTVYDNDGTANGTMTGADLVIAKIGDGVDFDGGDDYINSGNNSSLDVTGALTISVWAKGTPNNDGIVSKLDTSVNFGYRLVDDSGSAPVHAFECRFNDGGNHAARGTSAIDGDIWQHAVAVFVPSTAVRLYVDGVLETENTTSIPATIGSSGAINLLIAARNSGAGFSFAYDGIIDEARVSKVARNACWVKTSYDNQVSPQTFSALGEEEMVPSGGTLILIK